MKAIKQFVIQRLLGDSQILSLLGGRNVFAAQRDMIPETFPAIVVFDVGGKHRSIPHDARDALLQVSIMTTTSMFDADTIYERVTSILNTPIDSTARFLLDSTSNQAYWIREDSVRDLADPTRNLYHKALTFRAWGRTTK